MLGLSEREKKPKEKPKKKEKKTNRQDLCAFNHRYVSFSPFKEAHLSCSLSTTSSPSGKFPHGMILQYHFPTRILSTFDSDTTL